MEELVLVFVLLVLLIDTLESVVRYHARMMIP
jgi:hypothetical protein